MKKYQKLGIGFFLISFRICFPLTYDLSIERKCDENVFKIMKKCEQSVKFIIPAIEGTIGNLL